MTAKKRSHDTWAVFNIETDPDNFDFEVALGGVITGYPESEITLHDKEETVRCQVFIHRDRTAQGKASIPLRKLEVISPVDRQAVTTNCCKQLALALWLFRPVPWWISVWERRRDVRIYGNGLPLYSLREGQVGTFCAFARRLLGFHVRRNSFRFHRHLSPHSPELGEWFDASDPKGEVLFAKCAHLMIAMDLFEQAHQDSHLSTELQLMLLLMAAEALFTDEDKGELAYRLCHRVSVLIGANGGERKRIFEETKRLYDLRSRLIHGAVYRRKGGFVQIATSDISTLSNTVRSSLLYLIALNDLDRKELLKTLDRAVFDDKEMVSLRLDANRFWGFEKSPDEHLYASAWV